METKKTNNTKKRPHPLEVPYGTMHPESPFYVEREADSRCWQHLTSGYAETLYIQAPRQTGKSSLIKRMFHRIHTETNQVPLFVDLQAFPHQLLQDESAFLRELCTTLSEAAGVENKVETYWRGHRASLKKCTRYVEKHLATAIDKPFIIALDEANRLIDCPFRDNFFGMIRSWHNRRSDGDAFSQLTLILSSANEPYLLIKDQRQSPFNVASPIYLFSFTLAQISDLNQRHGQPLTLAEVEKLFELVGGHPFLVRQVLYVVSNEQETFATVLDTALDDIGTFGNHLQYFEAVIQPQETWRKALAQIKDHQHCDDHQAVDHLRGLGLIERHNSIVKFTNQLYARYFGEMLA